MEKAENWEEKLYTLTFSTHRASVNVQNISVIFQHFSDMQNHVGFRTIFQPENEGHRRKIIYRDKEDGKTNILVISEF